MTTRTRSRHLSWAAAAALAAVAVQVQARAQVPSDEEIQPLLEERLLPNTDTGFVVGILESGRRRIVTAGRAGAPGVPTLDANTVFEIGSTTKVFTASILASMVDRGEVRLDDPVAKYLPASVRMPKRGGRDITLEDLATHTSALPRLPGNMAPKDASNPYADYTVEQMYEFLSRYELPRDIGSQYEYSNLGVGLLGHVLALRAGTDYETLVTTRILKPLGMNDTRIVLSPAMRARLATGHDRVGAPFPSWDLPTLAGAGALRSTVNDMLTFAAANLDGTNALAKVLQSAHPIRHDTTMPQMGIGLAWHVRRGADGEIVWHNGGTGGSHSFLGLDKKAHTAVVILHNSVASHDDLGFHLLDTRLPLAKPEPPPKTRTEVPVPTAVLDSYVGEYAITPAFTLTITRDGDGLSLQATGQPKLRIYAESETEFFLRVVDAQITFVREGGPVTGLVLHQNGRDLPGKKK